MKIVRAAGLVFCLITVCVFGYLSFILYTQDGFYNNVDQEINLLEFTIHVMVFSNLLLFFIFLFDWKKVNALKLVSSYTDQNLIDLAELPIRPKAYLSKTHFAIRMIICGVSIISFLFFIFSILRKLIKEMEYLSEFAIDDILFFVILLVYLCFLFAPLIYHLKLYKAKMLI